MGFKLISSIYQGGMSAKNVIDLEPATYKWVFSSSKEQIAGFTISEKIKLIFQMLKH